MQDLRYAFRMLVKRPGFTAVAVMTLALGIGASTAIFSIVDAVLLRSLPYPEPDRVVQVREVSEKGSQMAFAEPNFLDLRERSQNLEAVAQYSVGLETIAGGSEPVRARTSYVSADFFRVLGVQPIAGRTFAADESKAGGPAVAVVSYGFWQRLLGGRADLARTALGIDDRSYTVIGVMPAGFNFPQNAEVWMPRELFTPQTSRSAHNWSVVARLRQGASVEQAQADATAIARQLKEQYSNDMDGVDFALVPLHEYLVGNVRSGLLTILIAVGFLLLVACTNVANLLLAQVTGRYKEFAVRAALGATRWRLMRQFVTENVLLVLPAALFGTLLSYWGVSVLLGLNQGALPRADEIGVDARALAFTLGLSLVIAVALGLVPVIRFSRHDLQDNLKQAGRGQSSNPASNRLRGLLVVSQVALTLALLIGAGLLSRSFYELLRIDPGFKPESAVVMDLSLPSYDMDPQRLKQLMEAFQQLRDRGVAPDNWPSAYDSDERQRQLVMFHQRLLDRVSSIPGVIAVGSSDTLPMSGGGSSGTFLIDNNPNKAGQAEYRLTTGGYFAAMGIPLLGGRLFEPSDSPQSPPVAVINKSLAEKQWPGEDPIGKRIQFGNMDGDLRLLTVVGVVGDVRERGLESSVTPALYAYALQRPQRSAISVVARAQSDPAALVSAMREAVRELNAQLPTNFRTLEQIFSSSLDQRRFSLVIFAVFAVVALLLAVMGVYGVVAYSVTQRTHEIGVRVALGAQPGQILRLIVSQGFALVLVGIVIGIGAAFALTRMMSGLLYGVGPTDTMTFVAIPLMLALAALVASYIPARRATRVSPMEALRYE